MLCFIHEKVSHGLITKYWTPQSNHRDTFFSICLVSRERHPINKGCGPLLSLITTKLKAAATMFVIVLQHANALVF